MNSKKNDMEVRICGHCGNSARMEMVAGYQHSIELGGRPYTDEYVYHWGLYLCLSCHKPTLEEHSRATVDQGIESWPWQRKILYPKQTATMANLPQLIKKNFEAALKVKNVDPNSFAVSIGRTLEAVCSDRKANGKNLFEKLNNLSKNKEIPERLSEMAQNLRLLRNIGAHSDLGNIDKEDVPLLFSFCEAILLYIYVAPEKINMIQKRINSLKSTNKG